MWIWAVKKTAITRQGIESVSGRQDKKGHIAKVGYASLRVNLRLYDQQKTVPLSRIISQWSHCYWHGVLLLFAALLPPPSYDEATEQKEPENRPALAQ